MRPHPPLNSLPAGLAAPDPSTFAVSYAAEANSIPRARRALRAFAEAGGATLAELDDIALASSEAITNVVQHAYVGIEGDVHVSARFKSRGLCIAVADDGLGLEHVTPNPGLGRGLDVMQHISDMMTLTNRPCGGVEVRLRFELGERTVAS